MAEHEQHHEETGLQAPNRLIEALRELHEERIKVPGEVDNAVLRAGRKRLSRIAQRRQAATVITPQRQWWIDWLHPSRPWLAWGGLAAAFALVAWLAHSIIQPGSTTLQPPAIARQDINQDGQVDILDAFALARQIESGTARDPQLDINGDGVIDRLDADKIAEHSVKLDKDEPS